MRSALRLSRLEIRGRWQLRRPDERAGRKPVRAQGAPNRVSDLRIGGCGLGLYGSGREDPAAAEVRLDTGSGEPPTRQPVALLNDLADVSVALHCLCPGELRQRRDLLARTHISPDHTPQFAGRIRG